MGAFAAGSVVLNFSESSLQLVSYVRLGTAFTAYDTLVTSQLLQL